MQQKKIALSKVHTDVPWYFTNNEKANRNIHLCPANGILAASYQEFFTSFTTAYNFSTMDTRGAWSNNISPDEDCSYHDYAEDLIKAIEQQHKKPLIGIGHSMGAVISVLAAVKRPDMFSHLIIIDGACTPNYWQYLMYSRLPKKMALQFRFIKGCHFRQRVWNNRADFIKKYRQHPTYQRFTEASFENYAHYALQKKENGKYYLRFHPHWESYNFRKVKYLWHYVRKITIPTLVIRAEHSYLYSETFFRKQVAQFNDNISAITLADTYHLLTHEQPHVVANAIEMWLTTTKIK